MKAARQFIVLLLIGLIPAIGMGASAAMVATIFQLEYAFVAPVVGLVCGLMVRFVSPGYTLSKALAAGFLAALGYAAGAVVRGALKIAIELAESPANVFSNLDWSVAQYLLLAALRSNRWLSLVLVVVLASMLVRLNHRR